MISRKYLNGETIYRRGESAAAAFEVREGNVRLFWPGQGGLSAVLGVGEIFGAAELIAGRKRLATAEALGDAIVSELGRDELARVLAHDGELASALLRPVFDRLRPFEDAAPEPSEVVALPPAELVVLSELRLKPAAREMSQQMDNDGIRIATLPFRVGRRSSRASSVGDGTIDLALSDTRPYSLSRLHFAIETHDGDYVVRDCGSHHGTIVNGARIGGNLSESVAPLIRGENRIVAGGPMSPFRFTLTIEGG
jgi:hypothetical protein